MKLSCFNLSRKTSFISMMLLTSSFFLVEIIVGYLTNSMALVADSFHMLSDLVSLLVGFLALRYSKRGRKTGRYTFGYARAEVLGALVNAVFLVALCFSILVESLKRFIIAERIENAKLVLYVGIAGLIVNIIGLFLFHQHGHGHSHGGGGGHGHSHGASSNPKETESDQDSDSETEFHDGLTDVPLKEAPAVKQNNGSQQENHETDHTHSEGCHHGSALLSNRDAKKKKKMNAANQLNMRGVYLHVLGDALGSVIVVISALIIMFEDDDWTMYVDPTMSVLMVLIILKTSIPLLKESSMILMQTVPTHLKIQEIKDKLVDQVEGVLSIHEFHIWQLAGNRIIASAHVKCHSLADYMAIANQLKEFFHNEGIHSTTIQPEFEDDPTTPVSEVACMLECGPEKNCEENRCCGPQSPEGGMDGLTKRIISKKKDDDPADSNNIV